MNLRAQRSAWGLGTSRPSFGSAHGQAGAHGTQGFLTSLASAGSCKDRVGFRVSTNSGARTKPPPRVSTGSNPTPSPHVDNKTQQSLGPCTLNELWGTPVACGLHLTLASFHRWKSRAFVDRLPELSPAQISPCPAQDSGDQHGVQCKQ